MNTKALRELQAQLKQRGYSSHAIQEILKWYR
jgi:broad-specificity NMP kinase